MKASTSFAGRILALLPFFIPLSFLALVLPVFVHEVVGHGGAAWLLGGEFHGFEIHLDGMGWSYSSPPSGAPPFHRALVLLAGSASTLLAGLVLLAIAAALRRRTLLRLGTLGLALAFLVDDSAYMFWNSLHTGPPGDFGRVLAMCQGSGPRVAFLAAGAAIMVWAIVRLTGLLLAAVEEWCAPAGPMTPSRRTVLVSLVVLVPAALWFVFDWDQIVPGIGVLPSATGAILHGAAGVFFRFRPPSPAAGAAPLPDGRLPWALAWGSAAVLFLSIVLWFRTGVRWS